MTRFWYEDFFLLFIFHIQNSKAVEFNYRGDSNRASKSFTLLAWHSALPSNQAVKTQNGASKWGPPPSIVVVAIL